MPIEDPAHCRRSPSAWTAAVILLLSARTAAAADVSWSAGLAFEERYDDNIADLSDKDISRLERLGGGNGFPCGSESTLSQGGRYSIEAPDDYVSVPRLSSALEVGWLKERPSAFEVELVAHHFARSSIKNWQSYRVGFSQPLHAGDFQTSIALSYGYVPYYYYRNLRSYWTANELGVLPPPRRQATYGSHDATFQFDQVLVPRRLWLRAVVGRESKDYNRCFNERDSRMPFRQVELALEPLRSGVLRLRIAYRREDVYATGDLAETTFFTEPDVSNRRDIYATEVRVRWGKKGKRTTLGLRYDDERRDYSTGNPNDIYHYGRVGARRHITFAANIELRKSWFLTAGAERTTNRSSFPVAPGSSFLPEDITDFNRNVYRVGFGYDFRLRGKKAPKT